MKKKTVIIGLILFVSIILSWYAGLGEYLSLANIKQQSGYFKMGVEHNYALAVLVFMVLYTFLVAVGLPVVAPMSIVGGFLFGALPGTLYSSISTTVGSITSFLLVRHAMSNVVRERYRARLDKLNKRIKIYGYNYLVTLHLITIVPFFVINTLAALADVPLLSFVWTTIVGALPILFIYSYAGRQLVMIHSIRDILRPQVLIMLLLLALLSLLPMIIRKIRHSKEL